MYKQSILKLDLKTLYLLISLDCSKYLILIDQNIQNYMYVQRNIKSKGKFILVFLREQLNSSAQKQKNILRIYKDFSLTPNVVTIQK